MTSNVGSASVYEAGDQRNAPESEKNNADRFHEGKKNSHKGGDSKDERTFANKVADESKRQEEDDPKDLIRKQIEQDATLPARSHGNEPSKGAVIDEEIRKEEEEIMSKKGSFGPKASN